MADPLQQETLQIKISHELKEAIRRCALECDETVRTFVLRAVRGRGVAVSGVSPGKPASAQRL